jgi:hypothetical protein
MSRTAPVKLAVLLSWVVGAILFIVPFHAFLTVWLSSWLGHYTLLRLWKEFLLLPVVLGALYILMLDKQLRRRIFSLWLTRLIIAYAGLLLAAGFIALAEHGVTSKAMWYGLLSDLRFLVFFLSVLVIAGRSSQLRDSWRKILFIPAIIVAAFAIIQYLILPYDFLKHFGYGDSTISPYETINHNLQHIRVASTLRGANPLGAYLILPICALAASFLSNRRGRRDEAMLGFGLALALAFSFSRSAWIGAIIGVSLIVWYSFKSFRTRKIIGWWLAGALVLGCLAVLALRNNLNFENAVFHTDRQSTIAASSNQGHSAAFKAATKDIIHHPLGSGVGTAGPQSTYNYGHNGRISENYFLQIGQEAGVLGMLLFIAICFGVARLLYDNRADKLALALLASLAGLSLVNFLSHAWADDTLAYVWWGLAGIVLAPILTDRAKAKNGQKIKKS